MSESKPATTEPSGPSPTVIRRCPKHGSYEAYASTAYSPVVVIDCPRCIDEQTAAQERERTAARREREEVQMRQRKLREIEAMAGIPKRFIGKTLDNYRATLPGQRLALTICRTYAATWPAQYGKGGSLVLTGGPGTGKTHLACAIAQQVMHEHMASAAFGTVSALIRGVRSTYGAKSKRSEEQAMHDLLVPDLLIIDEVGAQTGSDHELQLLFEIINGRYQNLRPTILISNLNRDDLNKFLGQRVMDRFNECGTVVAFDWDSHRGQGVA